MKMFGLVGGLLRNACMLVCCLGLFGLSAAADMNKTLHVLMKKSESSFDPATASDFNTLCVLENIFDSMLRYDYLARPLKLQPNTLRAMPEVDQGGTRYTFHLQPGIHFAADPAFEGKPRELIAADYAYSIKRLYDPTLHSPWSFLFQGKLVGDEVLSSSAKAGKFDPSAEIAGIKVLDRYTLQLRLYVPDRNFLLKLAMPATAAVAQEVVRAHAEAPGTHPVGTGPYLLKSWQRSERIVLEANPDFRDMVFNADAGDDAESQAILRSLKGKRLPIIGRIEMRVIEEQETEVLAFLDKQFDLLEQVPPPVTGLLLEHGKLKPALQQAGIKMSLFPALQTYYMWMNMDDPVLGGYTPERVALRRAIEMGYNGEEDIALLDRGMAVRAQSPLPPNAFGYDPAYRNPVRYDPELARKLLDHYGYRVRDASGFRSDPLGKPLLLTMHTQASSTGKLRDELWRKSLNAIGLRVEFKSDSYTEIIRASRLGKVQMFETDWLADYPDAENFYQLLYSPNKDRANYAHFNRPEFDERFVRMLQLPDGPERTKVLNEMANIVHAYTPWVIRTHPLSLDIRQPWLLNYKRHPVEFTGWRYWDLAH